MPPYLHASKNKYWVFQKYRKSDLLNVITLGHGETDNINLMITISEKYWVFQKYRINYSLNVITLGHRETDNISWMITISEKLSSVSKIQNKGLA